MRHTLYLAKAEDDRYGAYAYAITNFKGTVDQGVYIAVGRRKNDESYCGHIALQRALRQATKKCEGPVQLTIVLDDDLAECVAYEVMSVLGRSPLYPALCRTTQRIMRRFDSAEFAAMTRDESDLRPAEAAVIDDALEALEDAGSLMGGIKLRWQSIVRPKNIIR